RQVPGGGTADGREAELAGLRERHRDDAILERQRREIDGVVLDPQLLDAERLGQAMGTNKRSAADERADGRFAVDGQQLAIAPHVERAHLDLAAINRLADGVVVVIDFERAEIVFAIVERLLRVGLAAQTTLEAADKIAHNKDSQRVM